MSDHKKVRLINGKIVKLKNRRVIIGEIEGSADYGVIYKNLVGWRDIRTTKFCLSQEAAIATAGILTELLEKRFEEATHAE